MEILALILGGLAIAPRMALALDASDADAMFGAFNSAFLKTSGSDVFYKEALNIETPDKTWAASLDILAAEDAYERTGDPEKKTLVNDLLTTWLKNTPPPWDWDGWNDDLGWFSMALIRGYQITGNPEFLTQARYGFDYAFGRGWDTKYNDGGIWEENPEYAAKEDPPREPEKEALSNDSLGKVACLIYQSTHDTGYLDKCKQIYNWVTSHIYDSSTGQVNKGIAMNGEVNHATAAYNQGTFIDYANLLYQITRTESFYNDAKKALDFGRNNLTVNGIFSNDASYLNTWADEFARGAGHFIRDNRLWDTYYSWMVENADSLLANRRSDLGITWNAWDKVTPTDNSLTANKFVSALAWLQYTPATQPNNIGGVHLIVNQESGLAIDSASNFGNGKPVVQWGVNKGLAQLWLLTQNSDTSWNIVSLSTWQSLDCPKGSDDDSLEMIQWQSSRNDNQRWWIDRQDDGSYKIWNQASSKALDGASNSTNGAPLVQNGWNGASQQRWLLQ
jgi:hypothetical protein